MCATLPVISMTALGQGTEASEEEAVRLARAAEIFEANARILTLFNRSGDVIGTVGEREMYYQSTLSPDGRRIAVAIGDLEQETVDLWVVDVAGGKRTRITEHDSWDIEWAGSPVWSPDGTDLAYVGKRAGYEGVYRISADGEGDEKLLYRHPGANLWLGDWSPDGHYLSASTEDLAESHLYLVPVDGSGEIRELLHTKSWLMAGSFSPDGKLLAYSSEETGVKQIYVRELGDLESTRQISVGGGSFSIRGPWNPDTDELLYLAAGQRVMAAGVDGDLQSGTVSQTRLFDLSLAIRPGPIHISSSRDGDRILVAVPHSPKLEQVTVFDRAGKVLQRLGEPGVWRNPTLSPDGSQVAVRKLVHDSSVFDIWTFDLESGDETAVTDDRHLDNWPVWSPDSLEVAYMSRREPFAHIYRKSRDGTGDPIDVFSYEPGAYLTLTDWSHDGKFLSFNDSCQGVLYVVPLAGDGDPAKRNAMEWVRDEFQVALARFSPDSRHIAYLSDEFEPDVFNVYIAPFDPNRPDGRVEEARPIRVSSDDVLGMISWREDGRELYYLTRDWQVMSVELNIEAGLVAADPQVLFELPGPLPGVPGQWKSVTPDGQRFVFVLDVPVTIE